MRKIEKARNMMIEETGKWIDIFDVPKDRCPSDFGMEDMEEEKCYKEAVSCFECWAGEVEDDQETVHL